MPNCELQLQNSHTNLRKAPQNPPNQKQPRTNLRQCGCYRRSHQTFTHKKPINNNTQKPKPTTEITQKFSNFLKATHPLSHEESPKTQRIEQTEVGAPRHCKPPHGPIPKASSQQDTAPET